MVDIQPIFERISAPFGPIQQYQPHYVLVGSLKLDALATRARARLLGHQRLLQKWCIGPKLTVGLHGPYLLCGVAGPAKSARLLDPASQLCPDTD
ncbi:unnamed protein product [Phytophthora fragariaefolia]|uniref:Unnamed protein product n=1 Tax=Phytophthora fragariaefolia TaxID=1490495 RepID=A0A9W6WVY0_9STRA|nr:unnamed protein product [Phytophthora fragariaefolia]